MNEIQGPQFKRRSIGGRDQGETLTVTIAVPGKFRFPQWLYKLIADDHDRTLREVFDHPRHIGNIAYSEPYGASDESMTALVLFCKKHKLRFSIIGKSHNYPSETFRIVIWRPADVAELKNLCHWAVWK
jgi:hypothetical protein